MASRAALAAPLLLQAPPGQVPNVYEDLTGLVGSEGDSAQADEEEFKKLASKVREEHNLQQHIVVDLPDGKGKSILCASAVHASGSGRFLAPRQELTYSVNHETLVSVPSVVPYRIRHADLACPFLLQTTSDARPYKPNTHVESLRSQVEKQLSVYIEDRFATGLVEVFAVPLPRVQVSIKEETVQKAQDGEAEEEATPDKPSTSLDSDDAMKGQEGGQKGETALAIGEGDEAAEKQNLDETMKDVQDDPVETAQAMEEVESDNKSASASVDTATDEDEETEGETKLVIHIVANRYKLTNFW